MRISAQLDETYYNPFSNINDVSSGDPGHTLGGQISEPLVTAVAFDTLSSQLNEPLDAIPTATLSSQMYSLFIGRLIAQGVDTTTGQYKNFQFGDVLVRTNNIPYSSPTGIQGFSGVQGVTGLPGAQGATGLVGTTGLEGITGFSVNGVTGIQGLAGNTGLQGATGLVGSTGLSSTGMLGAQGVQVQGTTGIQGLTGAIGVTGIAPGGATGLMGDTGLTGNTGLQGITGSNLQGFALQGETGVMNGPTGLFGITGLGSAPGMVSYTTLNVQGNLIDSSVSYAIAGNTLNDSSQQIEFVAWGQSATDGTATTITVTFGGSTVLTTIIAGAAGLDFYIRGLIIRIGMAVEENLVTLVGRDGVMDAERSSTTVDLTLTQSLQIILTGAGSGYQINALLVRKVTQ